MKVAVVVLVYLCVLLCSVLSYSRVYADGADPGSEAGTQPVQVTRPPQTAPYARFAKNLVRGWIVNMPTPANYVIQDPLGVRSAMADAGLYVFGFTNTTFSYDLLNHGEGPRSQQVYAGQEFTVVSPNFLLATYDLGKIGLSDGQLTASLAYAYVNWEPAGPTVFHVGVLQYHQALFERAVELTIGYLGNSLMWLGTYVGGNLAGGTFGVSAQIPQQTGLSNLSITRPGANLKLNFGHGFYNLIGVQRPWNPDGTVAETKANGFGLGWGGKHVGMLYMEELGFERRATVDAPAIWVRTGAVYNTSGYSSLKTPGERDHNYNFTFLADYQLLRLGRGVADAYRGLYSGISLMYAPPDVNRFSQYYEARLYMKAPFASRPADSVSFVVNQNRYSRYAIRNAKDAGRMTVDESTSVALSYTANVVHGLFITGGFTFVDHPRAIASQEKQDPALNVIGNVNAYF